jgi:2-polyprenyl-3-methyl-5-hydroxy-6-metoxy-1,4-benzoquinol methylase
MLTATQDQPISKLDVSRFARRSVSNCLSCDHTKRQVLFEKVGYHVVRCERCGLVYISDPPTNEELLRCYSFANSYQQEFVTDQQARDSFLERGRLYLSFLSQHTNPGRLLDVGCSAGFFLHIARTSGWDVKGLEYSEDTAQLGRSMFNLDIQIGDLMTCSYESEAFDALTLWDVIEHVPDPLEVMVQAHHLLSFNGLVAISTPNIDGIFPRLSYQIAQTIDYWPHPEPPAHLTQFSTKTLSLLLENAGFRVVNSFTRRIPMQYSFGTSSELIRSPKRLAYAAVFAPWAFIGPWIGMGDEVVMVAQKR